MEPLPLDRRLTVAGRRSGLDFYLDEIGREPLLTREEEVALARRFRGSRDRAALSKLVRANLRFVVSMAKRYRGRGVPFEDLINEGNLGLVRAAERFDAERGVRFVTYAAWWVRQAMLGALEAARPGPSASSRAPGTRDGPAVWTSSLDARAGTDGDRALLEVIPDPGAESPDRRLDREALCAVLEAGLALLPEREERVLRLHFGLDGEAPVTLAEIGRRTDISRERVRQIKERGLARLRRGRRGTELEAFLGE